jgi:GrpB-like predicted nucleotidyltransferase (UPF0157 family)
MIYVQEYNPEWINLYAMERNKISSKAGAHIKHIEHVGSTAVPNLAAKPTIDICIGVGELNAESGEIISKLFELGYEYLPHLEIMIPERKYLQKLDNAGNHLFHIHIVAHGSRLWKEYTEFRDYLINHTAEAVEYQKLKKQLAKLYSNDREAYTEGKAKFIKAILEKASTDSTINK